MEIKHPIIYDVYAVYMDGKFLSVAQIW